MDLDKANEEMEANFQLLYTAKDAYQCVVIRPIIVLRIQYLHII